MPRFDRSGLHGAGRKTTARAYDTMIAAVAVANDLPLYTCNPVDFTDIEDLEVMSVPRPETPQNEPTSTSQWLETAPVESDQTFAQ